MRKCVFIFNKMVPIQFVSKGHFDFNAIDSRIRQVGDSIAAPESCVRDIIKKLESHPNIMMVNGTATNHGVDYFSRMKR